MMSRSRIGVLSLMSIVAAAWWLMAEDKRPAADERKAAMAQFANGNFKDAYGSLRRLALDPSSDPREVSNDFNTAITCLQKLGRIDEIDEFRDQVIGNHKENWRLLRAAALSFLADNHYGYINFGEFHRGHSQRVSCQRRDRVRALKLFAEAVNLAASEADKPAVAELYLQFAEAVRQNDFHAEFHSEYGRSLYDLTDIAGLPELDNADAEWDYRDHTGIPVDDEGKPIFHTMPKDYSSAVSDGERWRWLLAEAQRLDPALRDRIELIQGEFWQKEFEIHRLERQIQRALEDADATDDKTVFALHNLADNEFIARLETGPKRIQVPDECNCIKIFERIAARGKSASGEKARDHLAWIYEKRRQYEKAVAALKAAIEEYGTGDKNERQRDLNRIVGNWGQFEEHQDGPAGVKPVIPFRFRNAKKVTFEVRAIKAAKFFDDAKDYLSTRPEKLDRGRIDLAAAAMSMVDDAYLDELAASWDVALDAPSHHCEKLTTITVPVENPGAYLLTARIADGNTVHTLVSIADTAIAHKALDGKLLYYVADSRTGQPLPGAQIEFVGWHEEPEHQGDDFITRVVDSCRFSSRTNKDGMLVLSGIKLARNFDWLITARRKDSPPNSMQGFAYFEQWGIDSDRRYDESAKSTKAYIITDRPVYRPGQAVKFKAWVGDARYDEPHAKSWYSGSHFTVSVYSPLDEKISETTVVADDFGGISGEVPLRSTATLGKYFIRVRGGARREFDNQVSFRVEEYKKPEFEVTVETPKGVTRLPLYAGH